MFVDDTSGILVTKLLFNRDWHLNFTQNQYFGVIDNIEDTF